MSSVILASLFLAVAPPCVPTAGRVTVQSPDEAPSVTLRFTKPTAKPGQALTGTVVVAFAPGLHAYQNPPSDEFQVPVSVKVIEKGFKLIKATYPPGTDYSLPGEAKPAKVYTGSIVVYLNVQAPKKPGIYNVNVKVDYQQCNESACFPPGSVIAKAKLIVAAPRGANH